MCEINKNQERFIYLRNDDTGECWNIGESPLLEKLKSSVVIIVLPIQK